MKELWIADGPDSAGTSLERAAPHMKALTCSMARFLLCSLAAVPKVDIGVAAAHVQSWHDAAEAAMIARLPVPASLCIHAADV